METDDTVGPDTNQEVVMMSRLSKMRVSPEFSIRHTLFLALFCMLLLSASTDKTANACASCLNGGQQLLPNNIFGFCRCKCDGYFMGPRCQFMSKKRASKKNGLDGYNLNKYLMQQLLYSQRKRSDELYDLENVYSYSNDEDYFLK